jgi:hypothetical protein
MGLAVLQIVVVIEQLIGPAVEVENIVRLTYRLQQVSEDGNPI